MVMMARKRTRREGRVEEKEVGGKGENRETLLYFAQRRLYTDAEREVEQTASVIWSFAHFELCFSLLEARFLAAARGFALVVPPHRANQLKSSRPRGLGAPERHRCCLCCTARPALTYLYVTALAPKLLTATLSKSPHLSC